MVDPARDDQEPSGGGSKDKSARERARRFLSGAAKRNAPKGAASPKGDGSINPRTVWTAEQRAKQSARVKAYWWKKQGHEGEPPASASPAEEVLEVKGEPKPVPPASKPSKEDVEGWAGLIYLGHVLGSSMLKVPELGISKPEADQLSIASMNVMRHYSATILSEKSQDWIKFGMVAGAVYIPRFAAAKTRVKATRDAKKKGTVPPGQNPLGGFERPPTEPASSADMEEDTGMVQ